MSQTAGVVPVNVLQAEADMLAFPGHKGCMVPRESGSCNLGPGELGPQIRRHRQPIGKPGDAEHIPDRYEAGTRIRRHCGLVAGIEFVRETGLENSRS